MKSIKELELLVNFAKSLGQAPDPKAVEQIREHYEFQKKIIESVKANSSNDLSEAFGQKIEKEPIHELVQTQAIEENLAEETLPDTATTKQSLAERAAKLITEAPKKDSYQQPDVPLVDGSMKAVRDKLKFLEQWLGKVSMTGSGGGEVKLRFLDDVDRQTISDGLFLKYSAASGKFIFASQEHDEPQVNTAYVTTSSYTLSNVDSYVGIDYAGPANVFLPSVNVSNGRLLYIKDESGNASINQITINGNIDNDSSGAILATNNGSLQLIYRNGWRIV